MKRKEREKRFTVIYVGSNEFPFGSATVQRQVQLSKSLLSAGFDVVVINRRGGHSKSIVRKEKIKVHGIYQQIEYFYSSLCSYKPKSFFLRNLFKLTGYPGELFLIVYFRVFKSARILFVRAHKLHNLKYYYYVSRALHMELIYDYVEFYSSLRKRDKNSLDDFADGFDYQFIKYVDKLIVISDFLLNHSSKIDPEIRILKIPPVIDFDFFDSIEIQDFKFDYFVFCGNAAYHDIINFVILAFQKSKAIDNNFKLRIILHGNDREIENCKLDVHNKGLKDFIIINSKLPYSDLVRHYKEAKALFIPLTKSVQDMARFPFKICEYLASKRPIITSDVGEIVIYFENGKNALIADSEIIDSFVAQIDYVIDNPEKIKKIGEEGYLMGRKVFDYKSYSHDLKKLIVEND